ncbi:23S rRNA (pseudouridine(1915)-N(3))-methyltransferase RlmH [Candidatus Peregrinibacteria bacterium]|jgi:23S rRNA (pseudouridine1915-N3)-methyltransferase|nr:23S rRNA (pseudouridine(1915)-N(3))-methyltransferase RlmH [Candidatus Peregrinibacteria bacterium]MBT4148716.1 23S rRNA (pseudouridine(1915)-N(3))-methyltransferase RlmH [Candidatus Peregrinibacteria bacterium]MBT4456285.1 23S rRNA (pseudouridine(1915)-N(3))-methyltransferase RlmH [Candidatus Peregrinibacteria bacterium]
MKIQIIQIGKNKDRYIEAECKEFVKRLQQFCNLEIVTLKSASCGGKMPREKVVAEDTRKVLSVVSKDCHLVVLDEKGSEMDSVKFSGFLGGFKDRGETLCFVIGGAFGLSDSLKSGAGTRLSFSKMTFTHQMVRLILLEQIYRGFCILNGKEYHY